MFAQAYMGRKRIFSNAFTLCARILVLGRSPFARESERWKGLRLPKPWMTALEGV
jgi:hypothetical protein